MSMGKIYFNAKALLKGFFSILYTHNLMRDKLIQKYNKFTHFSTNLVSALASLHMHNFPHFVGVFVANSRIRP